MSQEFPEELREPSRNSTWWVGRNAEPRFWWRDGVFPIISMMWITFNALVSDNSLARWILIPGWLANIGYLVWLFRCHREGRSPSDNRIDRWASAHPVPAYIMLGIAAVAVVAIPILRD